MQFIYLQINKLDCMNRVIKRDFIERGKSKNHAKKDFIKAWEIFYKRILYFIGLDHELRDISF